MVSYAATTDAVEVSVRPVYLDAKSDAVARRFVFAYFVRIENHGRDAVRLLRRRWAITDAAGVVEDVEGPGVVGVQPTIEPGESHTYHSFCVLQTFQGSMTGAYLMERPDGERFLARIPRFHLQAMTN